MTVASMRKFLPGNILNDLIHISNDQGFITICSLLQGTIHDE